MLNSFAEADESVSHILHAFNQIYIQMYDIPEEIWPL